MNRYKSSFILAAALSAAIASFSVYPWSASGYRGSASGGERLKNWHGSNTSTTTSDEDQPECLSRPIKK